MKKKVSYLFTFLYILLYLHFMLFIYLLFISFFFTRKVSTQKYALTTSFNARTPKKFQLLISPLWGFSVCRYSCATQFTRNYTYTFLSVHTSVRPYVCLLFFCLSFVYFVYHVLFGVLFTNAHVLQKF